MSVAAFYMDQTEITNNEYRQFVMWVKDSIARRILGEEFPEDLSRFYAAKNPPTEPTEETDGKKKGKKNLRG